MNIISDTLVSDGFYHIYNRGINGCEIFTSNENYMFFLIKFSKYLSDYVEVYSYCLMPNHFHFLIKIKSESELVSFVKVQNFDKASKEGLHSYSSIVSKQFAKFLSSYTQAFNKVQGRHGALLESPFKRKRVEDEEYLRNLILYIHLNPGVLKQNFEEYKFSSYKAIISDLKTNVNKQMVLELFDGLDNFVCTHKNLPKYDFKF